ncbi:MAG: type II secretion system protein GspN [Halobacteriovorax sp.]|nr:type II secretion system protein GspN [Halobacteriovorax sp.]|tara:strand:- start:32574 stop:33515 length:942 start_codon:yes stop_codon:yes gene_type:complete
MEKQEKLNENELAQGIYLSGTPIFKLSAVAVLIMAFAFFMNFPFEEKVKSSIVSAIKKNKSCPVSYTNLDLDFFLQPTLNFKNMNIPGACLGNRRSPGLDFDKFNLVLKRPTVLPPGMLFSAKAVNSSSDLNIFATAGIGSAIIRIEKSQVAGSLITSAANLPVNIKGSLSVDALIESDYKVPTGGSFHITSKDLNLPPQRIVILDIKGLSLAPLVLKGSMEEGVVKLQRLQIGNSTTKIEAIFTDGTIKINKINPKRHMVDLEGRVRLSEEFLKEFPVLGLYQPFQKASMDKNGFYRIQLKGPIGKLRPNFL